MQHIFFELYKLYKSYAAYINLLVNHNKEYLEEENIYEICFKDQDEDLFSQIKSVEYLICEPLRSFWGEEKIFLLPDKENLLIIESYLDLDSKLKEYFLKSNIFEIGKNCKGKIFTEEVRRFSSSDGWDYDDREVFAFFDQDKTYNQQITSTCCMTEQLKAYNGVDIRDILTPMSLEEIVYRLRIAAEEKTKKLILYR